MALLRLPEEMRGELKDPLGPVRTDVPTDLGDGAVLAIGDIVTAALLQDGVTPDVALVDGRTERERVDPEVEQIWRRVEHSVAVANPAGTVTDELVTAVRDALDADEPTRIDVDGEEDLAALPAIALADEGDVVCYGQPGEGMVVVDVDAAARDRVRDLLARMTMEGDDAGLAALRGDDGD